MPGILLYDQTNTSKWWRKNWMNSNWWVAVSVVPIFMHWSGWFSCKTIVSKSSANWACGIDVSSLGSSDDSVPIL